MQNNTTAKKTLKDLNYSFGMLILSLQNFSILGISGLGKYQVKNIFQKDVFYSICCLHRIFF